MKNIDNFNVDTVSPSEMKDNFNLIKKHIPIMKDNLSAKLKAKDDKLNSMEIEELIVKSLEESNLAPAGKRIVEGFYEVWMSIFMMAGNDKESLILAMRTIGLEV